MLRRQAFASLQHGFLRSVENVFIYNFGTPNGVKENVFLYYNIDTSFYYHCLADVMPDCVIGTCFLPGRCYLPFGMWQMLLQRGRCYPLIFYDWQMLLPYFLWKMLSTLYYVATH